MSKLLFIRYKKSKSILEGGEIASLNNLNVLSQLLGEDNIKIIYIHDETVARSVKDYIVGLWGLLFSCFFGLTKSKIIEIQTQAMSDNFDYVWIDRSVFGIIAKHLKKIGYKGRIITFFHNVEVQYFKAKLNRWMPHRLFVLWCADNNDRYSCKYSDKIVALNSRDEQQIIARYNRKPDVLIPISFKDKYRASDIIAEEKKPSAVTVLFVGAYFKPNNDGIKWFVKNVLPDVDINLKIVGKEMSKLSKEINTICTDLPTHKTVSIYSDVPDLAPFFEEADIVVLPIFSGGGMKVKTAESLMQGKNIFATTEAFEGYDVDYNKVGALCNSSEEFISSINDFKKNPRPKFNEYSREIFLKKYSEDAVKNKFEMLLR
jgi:hypothetical protein